MALAIAVLVVGALTAGFFMLASFEERTGRRFWGAARERMDAQASRAFALAREVDMGKFLFHALHAAWDHLVHDVVHFFLFVVRVLERTLTRAAREIRGRRAEGTSARQPFSEGVEKIKTVLRKEEADKVE